MPAAKKPVAKSAKKQGRQGESQEEAGGQVAEEAKPEKPRGLFAALFGGDSQGREVARPRQKTAQSERLPSRSLKAKREEAWSQSSRKPVELSIYPATMASCAARSRQSRRLFRRPVRRHESGDAARDPGARLRARRRSRPRRSSRSSLSSSRRTSTSPAIRAAPSSSIPPPTSSIWSKVSARPAATRIAVGTDGLQFKGKVKVGDKQEWPRWIPTKEMQEREPKKYGQYKDGMPGGGDNPLGARAIYLYRGQEGHASAHPRHHRAADDRHQFVEWLLPHGQRARHGPLPSRAGRHPGRRALMRIA